MPPADAPEPVQEPVAPVRSLRLLWIIGGALVVLLIGAVLLYLLFTRVIFPPAKPQPPAPENKVVSLSGTIDLNGTAPSGSTLNISVRDVSSAAFTTIPTAVSATDSASWSFDQAISEHSYEVKAVLANNGTTLGQADPIFLTAPAKRAVLRINVESTASAAPATVTGTIQTNGYIPAGSTITIQGRKSGTTQFTNVAQGILASPNQVFTYAGAVQNQMYDVQGLLINAGNVIGTSGIIEVTAPAAGELLQINSSAQIPASATPANQSISGNITINGSVPPGGTVVVYSRPTGTTQFNVAVNNVNPADGATWTWPATNGQSYDLVAVLKQPLTNGTQQDAATSNTVTVTAPAANVLFTLNSGFQLPGPTGSMSISCGTHSPNNTWTASVNFASVTGAGSYWFQVGSTSGGSDLVSTNQNATNNPTQTININVNDSVTYYARYAYAPQANAQQNQFSPFSYVQNIRCP